MYLTVIAWLYVVLMMSVVEAASPQGTLLGAFMTFVLYGLLPLGILVYIMGTPARWRARKAQAAQDRASPQTPPAQDSGQPDASGHAPAGLTGQGAGSGSAAPVREKS